MIAVSDCKRIAGTTRQAIVEDLAKEIGCSVDCLVKIMENATGRGKADVESFEQLISRIGADSSIWWYRTGGGFDTTAGYALVRNGVVEDAMQIFRS